MHHRVKQKILKYRITTQLFSVYHYYCTIKSDQNKSNGNNDCYCGCIHTLTISIIHLLQRNWEKKKRKMKTNEE